MTDIFAPFLNEYIGIQLRLGFVGNKLATMIMIDPKLQEIFKACKKLFSEHLRQNTELIEHLKKKPHLFDKEYSDREYRRWEYQEKILVTKAARSFIIIDYDYDEAA